MSSSILHHHNVSLLDIKWFVMSKVLLCQVMVRKSLVQKITVAKFCISFLKWLSAKCAVSAVWVGMGCLRLKKFKNY